MAHTLPPRPTSPSYSSYAPQVPVASHGGTVQDMQDTAHADRKALLWADRKLPKARLTDQVILERR